MHSVKANSSLPAPSSRVRCISDLLHILRRVLAELRTLRGAVAVRRPFRSPHRHILRCHFGHSVLPVQSMSFRPKRTKCAKRRNPPGAISDMIYPYYSLSFAWRGARAVNARAERSKEETPPQSATSSRQLPIATGSHNAVKVYLKRSP